MAAVVERVEEVEERVLGRAEDTADSAPRPIPSSHMRRVKVFVGGSHELIRAEVAKLESRTDVALVVRGMGGVGKSTAVFFFSQKFTGLFPGGIYLLNADTKSTLDASVRNIASSIPSIRHLASGKNAMEVREGVRAELTALPRRALIVVDNLDSVGMLEEVGLCLPPPDGHWPGAVIVTSRLTSTELAELSYHVRVVTLGLLSASHSEELLRCLRAGDTEYVPDGSAEDGAAAGAGAGAGARGAPKEEEDEEEEAALAWVAGPDGLDGWPLELEAAGRWVAAVPGHSFRQFKEELLSRRQGVLTVEGSQKTLHTMLVASCKVNPAEADNLLRAMLARGVSSLAEVAAMEAKEVGDLFDDKVSNFLCGRYVAAVAAAIRIARKDAASVVAMLRSQLPANADRLLCVLAWCGVDNVPFSLLKACGSVVGAAWRLPPNMSTSDLRTLLRCLENASLVKVDDAAQTVSMHRVVQARLRESETAATRAAPDLSYVPSAEACVHSLLRVLPGGLDELGAVSWERAVAEWQVWFQHCHEVMDCMLGTASLLSRSGVEAACKVLLRCGGVLRALHSFPDAEELLLKVLEVRERLPPPDVAEMGFTFMELGRLAFSRQRWEASIQYTLQAVEVFHGLGDKYVDNKMACVGALASACRSLGQLDEALRLHDYVVTFRKSQPQRPQRLGVALYNLGNFFKATKEYNRAAESFQEAIGLFKQLLSDDHEFVLKGYGNLGDTMRRLKRWVEAERLLFVAMKIRARVLPPNHADLGMSKERIGRLYIDKQEFVKAVKFFSEAVEIYRVTLGDHHKTTAATLREFRGAQAVVRHQGGRAG